MNLKEFEKLHDEYKANKYARIREDNEKKKDKYNINFSKARRVYFVVWIVLLMPYLFMKSTDLPGILHFFNVILPIILLSSLLASEECTC